MGGVRTAPWHANSLFFASQLCVFCLPWALTTPVMVSVSHVAAEYLAPVERFIPFRLCARACTCVYTGACHVCVAFNGCMCLCASRYERPLASVFPSAVLGPLNCRCVRRPTAREGPAPILVFAGAVFPKVREGAKPPTQRMWMLLAFVLFLVGLSGPVLQLVSIWARSTRRHPLHSPMPLLRRLVALLSGLIRAHPPPRLSFTWYKIYTIFFCLVFRSG